MPFLQPVQPFTLERCALRDGAAGIGDGGGQELWTPVRECCVASEKTAVFQFLSAIEL